jgi:hypothetical protein
MEALNSTFASLSVNLEAPAPVGGPAGRESDGEDENRGGRRAIGAGAGDELLGSERNDRSLVDVQVEAPGPALANAVSDLTVGGTAAATAVGRGEQHGQESGGHELGVREPRNTTAVATPKLREYTKADVKKILEVVKRNELHPQHVQSTMMLPSGKRFCFLTRLVVVSKETSPTQLVYKCPESENAVGQIVLARSDDHDHFALGKLREHMLTLYPRSMENAERFLKKTFWINWTGFYERNESELKKIVKDPENWRPRNSGDQPLGGFALAGAGGGAGSAAGAAAVASAAPAGPPVAASAIREPQLTAVARIVLEDNIQDFVERTLHASDIDGRLECYKAMAVRFLEQRFADAHPSSRIADFPSSHLTLVPPEFVRSTSGSITRRDS